MDAFGKQFLSKQRVLVVAPHADDETAGAGGLIARVKDAGGKAFVMVLSTDDLLHFDKSGKKTKGKTRRDELAAAMKTLSVDDWEIVFEGSPENQEEGLHGVGLKHCCDVPDIANSLMQVCQRWVRKEVTHIARRMVQLIRAVELIGKLWS